MKLVFISDTHCQLQKLIEKGLPKGDVLIHSGDALSYGSMPEYV